MEQYTDVEKGREMFSDLCIFAYFIYLYNIKDNIQYILKNLLIKCLRLNIESDQFRMIKVTINAHRRQKYFKCVFITQGRPCTKCKKVLLYVIERPHKSRQNHDIKDGKAWLVTIFPGPAVISIMIQSDVFQTIASHPAAVLTLLS